MEIKAKCKCGCEFVVLGGNFSIWHNECDCCGATAVARPTIWKLFVLSATNLLYCNRQRTNRRQHEDQKELHHFQRHRS